MRGRHLVRTVVDRYDGNMAAMLLPAISVSTQLAFIWQMTVVVVSIQLYISLLLRKKYSGLGNSFGWCGNSAVSSTS